MAEHLLIGDLAPLLFVLGLSGPLLAPILSVKVVQRLPVRIRFEPGQDLKDLRPGMSVVAKVRVR